MAIKSKARWWLVLVASLFAGHAQASPVLVTIDTTHLSGRSADLAFDLFEGGLPSNTVTIFDFSTNGTLGVASSVGGVSGGFSVLDGTGIVLLTDTDIVNEYLQRIILGTTLSFSFSATGNAADPESYPDAFAFYLLDPLNVDPDLGEQSLVFTLGPGNALVTYEAGVADPLHSYPGETIPTDEQEEPLPIPVEATTVPEPGALALAMAGLFALGLMRSVINAPRRKRVAA